jgi:hypothetical protein
VYFPAQGTLHMEEPKLFKEREDKPSQLNRLKPLLRRGMPRLYAERYARR